jgi:hypothetical protein
MDEVLMTLGLACLAVSAVWHAILRSWPGFFLVLGLELWLLAVVTPLKIG